MSNPVRFETIDAALKVDPGTVETWSKEAGFPVSGTGVACVEAVIAWRSSLVFPDGPAESEVKPAAISSLNEESADPVLDDIVWVTIRVPVARSAPALAGSNPVPTFRINQAERHLRVVWGKLLHGCRGSHVQMRSGRHVESIASSVKYVLEQIESALGGV